MRNVLAVLMIAAGAIAALTLAGGASNEERPASPAATAAPRWEYRVVSTRTAPRAKDEPTVRFVAWSGEAAEADALRNVERELNRLGNHGWDMCWAADGAIIFRRPRIIEPPTPVLARPR